MKLANQITGANGSGPYQVQAARLEAAVAQFRRWGIYS